MKKIFLILAILLSSCAYYEDEIPMSQEDIHKIQSFCASLGLESLVQRNTTINQNRNFQLTVTCYRRSKKEESK